MLNAFLVVLAIPPALTFLFKDPMVQTFSAKILTSLLTKQTGLNTEIHSLRVDVFSGIEITGLRMEDHRNNPMIRVGHLRAKAVYADWGLFGLVFSKLELDGASFTYGRYKGESDYNFNYLLNSLQDTTKAGGGSFKLHSKKLSLTASTFHLFDENKHYDNGRAMDYADILIDSIELNVTNFVVINDSLDFRIENLHAREQCGIHIKKMSTDFILSSTGLHAHGLLMDIANSTLDLDLDFNYSSFRSYSYFIDSVEMSGNFRPTQLQMDDLGFFAEIMFKMPNRLGLTGKVSGPVSNLKAKNLKIHFGKNSRIATDAGIKGLPDFFSSYMEAEFDELSVSACDFRNFALPVDEQHIDLSDQLKCEEVFHLSGNFKGFYEDFVTILKIKSDEGTLNTRLAFTRREGDTLYFDLSMKGDTVDVGRLFKQEKLLGKMNLDVQLNGRGNSLDDIFLQGKGMLTAVDFLDYNYRRVRVHSRYVGDSLMMSFRIGDKNLMLDANAFLVFADETEAGLNANFAKANLADLRLVPIPGFGFSGKAGMYLKGFDPENMTGEFTLTDSKLWFDKALYPMDSARLEKRLDTAGVHTLSLYSDFGDFTMNGKYDITAIPERVSTLANHFYKLSSEQSVQQQTGDNYINFEGRIKDGRIIKEQFVPGLDLSPTTNFQGKLDFAQRTIHASLNADKLVYHGITLNDNTLSVFTKNDRVFADFTNARIIIKDSTETDKTIFGIDNLELKANVGSDSLSLGIFWDNKDSTLVNHGVLEGQIATDFHNTNFVISKSDVVINDTAWQIAENNRVHKDSSGIRFQHIEITGGNSRLSVSGKYPHNDEDTLRLEFGHWNLSHFDILTRSLNFDLDGLAEGYLELSRIRGKPALISNLEITGFQLNKEYLGNLHLMNTWDNTNNSIFVKMQIVKDGNSGSGEILSVDGYYFPFKQEESLDLSIAFNRFRLRALESFASAYLSHVEGMAGGKLKLSGSIEKPQLTGSAELYRTSLLINYLNTKYSFSNDVEFKPDEIIFDNLVIYDTLGNRAEIDGKLRHNHFLDPEFDVKITTDKLLFFNTDRTMNDVYYGTAITSGNILISGSPNDIALDIKVASRKGTHVFLPMDYSVEIADKDYIIFIKHEPDTLESNPAQHLKEKEEKKDNDQNLAYDIKLNMQITPEAKVSLSLPADMGSIESEGTGDLFMHTNTDGDFTLIGDYTVSKGLFHFSIGNLVNKRFTLVEGGRISWTGDPYLANLNIKGLYRVKTNLSSLGIQIDSSANYKNKVNVECYVILTNQLLNPDLRFEIKFPDMDPDQQRMVYALLDTTNQAVVNQQMISLLVLGTFSFNNASNVGLNSAYYNVLTNQLSSMLSRISDDFDIGVNYKPGDEITQEEFDVALSTQLFDDRLTIDGNFGMTYDRSNQNASNVVGDVDIGYKLREDGQWVLKVFNHSNVNSWYNYNNYDKVSPYTQGIGIAFRKEFNTFAELFQRTRPKKEKKKKE
ncbi:MAG: translocation/assembly module TamB [Bacteroidales bacterium]|nr:translocation/assembly module TamB [Bacteroidales bacterium]